VNTSIIIIFTVSITLSIIGGIKGGSDAVPTKFDCTPTAGKPCVNTLLTGVPNYLDPADVQEKNLANSFLFFFIKTLGSWVLLFVNYIPISLMVSLELVKFWQAIFMTDEYMMFDEEQDMPMRAQSSNLNEELG
jgi:magnesium-transporting ATPase (P-type)